MMSTILLQFITQRKKVEKSYGKVHNNYQIPISTKGNAFTESYNKLNKVIFKIHDCGSDKSNLFFVTMANFFI